MKTASWIVLTIVSLTAMLGQTALAAPPASHAPSAPSHLQAVDTLAPRADVKPDARLCVNTLSWKPGAFRVTVTQRESSPYDRLIQFPSARPSGDARNDTVSLEWYQARDAKGKAKTAPAMIVVHESGSGMNVGRLFARTLRAAGIHTFMIHLPYYGERRRDRGSSAQMIAAISQAVADVRRARDAVAVLPLVRGPFGVQGTSLGGFVVATAGSIDRGYDHVFIMLAGGGLYDIVQNGQKDAAEVRRRLAQINLTGEVLKKLLWNIEPTRVAHRLNAATTWIYSAKDDTIVPLKNAKLLASAAGLDPQHHIVVAGNHYSCVAYFPHIVTHIARQMHGGKVR